jgi:hypothetical protein
MLLLACGGKGAAAGRSGPDLDSDPYALLPAGAIAILHVDAHGLFSSASVGSDLAAAFDPLVPLASDSGFVASRDVDSVVVGMYSTSNADVAAIISGRFDTDKMSHASAARSGSPIVAGTHGHFSTSTSGKIVWCVLTPKTIVAGTTEGVGLVLDRIEKGQLDRALPAWAVTTLQTPGAELALVADFTSQPIASAAIGSVQLPWLTGLRVARIVGNLGSPGLDVAGTLTYAEADQAQNAVSGLKSADRLLSIVGPLLGGLKLENLEVTSEDKDLRCKFGVDTQGLRSLVALAPRLVPGLTR